MMELDLFREGEGGDKPRVWSVSDLTDEIKGLLESKIGDVQVSGEISNFRRHSSGHLYFSLKDESAQISSVMFRGDASRLGFHPQDGDQVIAEGMLTVYKPRGSYQIRIRSLRPAGRGELQARFELLKRKLMEEGLFESEGKKALPVFPERIGVITSPTGAALRDFLQVLGRRCPQVQVVLGGVKVQGEGAAEEVAEMLRIMNERGDVDLIVVTRGGGSLEDLWAFNEESLARAIAASALPVMSAVGHEIDFTIADFVADVRAPTPSAAAELVATSRQEWLECLRGLERRLRQSLTRQVVERRALLNSYQNHFVFKEPVRLIETSLQRVDEMRERICAQVQRILEERRNSVTRLREQWKLLDSGKIFRFQRQRLEALSGQVRLLSPQGILERGYALTFDCNGKLVRKSHEMEVGQSLYIQMQDGRIYAKSDKKSEEGLTEGAGKKLDVGRKDLLK